jgi:GAF domain-containing protein
MKQPPTRRAWRVWRDLSGILPVIGVFGALSTHRRAFSQSDVSFVQAVTNVLASAVERSRAEQRLSDVT